MYPSPNRELQVFGDAPGAPVPTAVSGSLTYEPFYGLREKAFSLSADPRFLFRSPAHGPAFDDLLAGIRRREGLIVLTGEIGAGKTTLCRSVLQHLDRRTFAAFVADPFVSREDLLKTLLVDFGVISIGDLTRGRFNGASRSDLSYPLYEFLDSLVPLQAFAVVVIDEAQNLSLPLLEEIRILSELERRDKLLQVVLVGQPELRANLKLDGMRQVDQRVSVRCELPPLDAASVADYIAHRLRIASRGESRAQFSKGALEAIYEGSSGIPRLINRITDRSLQRAYLAESLLIDGQFVWEALDDLGLSTVPRQEPATRETSETPTSEAVVVAPSAAPATPPPVTEVAAPREAGAPVLVDLPELPAAELESWWSKQGQAPVPVERPAVRQRWAAAAAASFVLVSASIGVPAWYSRVFVDAQAIAAITPPSPAPVSFQPADGPRVDAALPSESPGGVAASGAAPVSGSRYTILVAAFTTGDRAERVVQELANAGFAADAVEVDGGPERGRFVQVKIGGYTSPTDVDRALQLIRALPGGYRDARVIQSN